MIKIYGVPRSRAIRCLWMAEETGVPYENVKTDVARGGARTPEFLRVNPNGHVPALEDGDLKLFESLAINMYLARQYGGTLWPAGVHDEGRVFQWSVWAMTELEEPIVTALVNRVFLPEAQRDAKRADRAEERARRPLGVLEGALGEREWLVGTGFGVADLNVASVLLWAPMAAIDLAPMARVAAWFARCSARPALARAQAR
jgi:glutathione S-transferase